MTRDITATEIITREKDLADRLSKLHDTTVILTLVERMLLIMKEHGLEIESTEEI